MPLALSTSWNACKHTNSRSMLFEIKQLNFKDIELSFNLTVEMLEEIPGVISDFGLKVVSLHNYCPAPEEFKRGDALPDCYSISSLDPQERKLAIKYTKRSIDQACALKASAVVLHCGRVEIEDKTRELILLYGQGAEGLEEFQVLRNNFIKERQRMASLFLDCTLCSLDELNLYARDRGIILGVENRFYYREIPSFEEVEVILDKFQGSNVFYWHDTGHERVMQNLGFAKNSNYLEAYGSKLAGIHLHNVTDCFDHQPLQRGDLNFSALRPYLKKETIKVIEVHQPAAPTDIRESRELLENIFNGII